MTKKTCRHRTFKPKSGMVAAGGSCPKCLRELRGMPHLERERERERESAEQDQLPCEPTGTSSGNCQKTESRHGSGMSHATTASPEPVFRTPWSAQEIPGEQLPAERSGRRSVLIHPPGPPGDPLDEGTEPN